VEDWEPAPRRAVAEDRALVTAQRMDVVGDGDGRRGDSQAIRILLVDDERAISDLVSWALRAEGFEVTTVDAGRAAVRAVEDTRPDLVVLDVLLPDIDGFEVQRQLRAVGHTVPVLYLTARDGVEDKVRGLTLGGDDYITKPFSVDELVARIRAVLRRAGLARAETDPILRLADLELDEETHEVRRAGKEVKLTPTEFKMLRYLLLNRRRVVTKAQIVDHVWEYDFGGDHHIVETYISYLRRKIDDGREPLIHTIRGAGYMLRTTESR
jgi:two-component system OmpR family response regulator